MRPPLYNDLKNCLKTKFFPRTGVITLKNSKYMRMTSHSISYHLEKTFEMVWTFKRTMKDHEYRKINKHSINISQVSHGSPRKGVKCLKSHTRGVRGCIPQSLMTCAQAEGHITLPPIMEVS